MSEKQEFLPLNRSEYGQDKYLGSEKSPKVFIAAILFIFVCFFAVILPRNGSKAVTDGYSSSHKGDITNIEEIYPFLNVLKSWNEESDAIYSYGLSKTSSQRKQELHEENLQDREYIHLGKSKEYVRVNTHDNRLAKRRSRMAAFDKIRVDYCGDLSNSENNWVRNDHPKTNVAGETGEILVSYAKNTLDYATTYNNNGYSAILRDMVPEDVRKRIRAEERERSIELDRILSKEYKVKRNMCERKWGNDAPEGYEEDDLTVSIERLGPFYSHGDYDWNSVMSYNDAVNMSSKFEKHKDIYVSGSFFLPVWPNGTVISYPPLHVHHTHLHPYPAKGMDTKIGVNYWKLKGLIEALESEEDGGYEQVFNQLYRSRHSSENESEHKKAVFEALKNAKGKINGTKLKQFMETIPANMVDHHVILQGHGDGECLNEQGGADCVLHLLEPSHGYRIHNSRGFSGNFEINDVRNRKNDYSSYFDGLVKDFKELEKDHEKIENFIKTKLKSSTHRNKIDSLLQHSDDNRSPHNNKSNANVRNLKSFIDESSLDYSEYVDGRDEGKLEFYIDVGIIWSAKKKTETTFLQFGNPPTGIAWMTYAFPLDKNTNMLFYNFTNTFLGSGELSNFILHSHMVYFDSIYVFKGDKVYETLDSYTSSNIPFIFECREKESLSLSKKEQILDLVTATGARLVCEGTKPTLVLYCDKTDDEECIYRDRRIDFNCLDKVRLEEGETLTILAFNKVREFTTSTKPERINTKTGYLPDLNSVAISSSFGFGWAAHQHSFFRGDFVSDRARDNNVGESLGLAEIDIISNSYAPPAYFWYGFLKQSMWDEQQKVNMVDQCPNTISFEAFLPWENLYADILSKYLE